MKLTSQQVKDILKAYPNTKAAVLAEKYGVCVAKIYSTAKRYRIKKSAEFMASEQSGRIKPGEHFSPDTELKKGQKIYGHRPRNQPKKPHPCAWRKGSSPVRTAKDGELRYRTVGWMIRLGDNKWIFYTRWLWITTYGEIPEGCKIVFREGCQTVKERPPTIDQLECLTQLELMNRNSGCEELTDEYIVHKLSHMKPHLKQALSLMPELIELKRTQIKLRRTINEHSTLTQND